jgi:hypothetical protein
MSVSKRPDGEQAMSDPDALLWTAKPPAPRQPKPGELLFEFVRASDRAPMSCELRFHGESYGWEAQFFEGGDFAFSHGGFPLRAMAVEWAAAVRAEMS